MSMATDQINVRLLKKTYEVACPPGQRESLDPAIKRLRSQMRTVREMDANASMERVAVIAALNLSHDFLRLSRELPSDLPKRVESLSTRIRKSLDRAKKANLS